MHAGHGTLVMSASSLVMSASSLVAEHAQCCWHATRLSDVSDVCTWVKLQRLRAYLVRLPVCLITVSLNQRQFSCWHMVPDTHSWPGILCVEANRWAGFGTREARGM